MRTRWPPPSRAAHRGELHHRSARRAEADVIASRGAGWPAGLDLTSRELDVLRLVAGGKPNKEIATSSPSASARHGHTCRGSSASLVSARAPRLRYGRFARVSWTWTPKAPRRDPASSGSRVSANTLRRCHSTVRGLRKSRAPDLGFDSPSRASWAICSSWAVSSSRVPLPSACAPSRRRDSSRRAARRTPPYRSRAELVVGGAKLLAASTRRFARRSHSPYSRCVRASSGAVVCGRAVRSPPVQRLGALVVAHQRGRNGPYPSAQSVAGTGRRRGDARRGRRVRGPARHTSSRPRAARSRPTQRRTARACPRSRRAAAFSASS
jgi:hypothetical protein